MDERIRSDECGISYLSYLEKNSTRIQDESEAATSKAVSSYKCLRIPINQKLKGIVHVGERFTLFKDRIKCQIYLRARNSLLK